jgi:hypothetical protein
MANQVRKVRLTRSIVMSGKHAEEGSVFECPAPLAQRLVGEGSAEYHEDHADQVAAENKLGVTVHSAHNDDPQPRKISDGPKPRATQAEGDDQDDDDTDGKGSGKGSGKDKSGSKAKSGS